MRIKDSFAQSLLEYAIIVVLVGSAFVSMSLYITRALNHRFVQMDAEYSAPED